MLRKVVAAILVACVGLASCATTSGGGSGGPPEAQAAAALAKMKISLPHTRYTLKNGLTLIVHEDRKAPVVHFNIWYHVGSKNEPDGQSGFAHLFEHLMFQGSENFNDDYFKATRQIGATEQNGTTSNDRTNYFQTVPKENLDAILWLESDRMGHFLGVVDQARLDEQRGVVQNEKRQGDNQPYAIAQDLVIAATYPQGHPYDHSVIGSLDDLQAAKLDQVKDWFRKYYGPSNAVVVLSGDISPAEALAKVEKFFGSIPPGEPVAQPKVWVAKRTGAQREIAYDRVAQPRLQKIWNIPEYGNKDTLLLDLYADTLAADRTSRLTKRLVYDEQVATSVNVFAGGSEIAGRFTVTIMGKPGTDMAYIERAVDEEMAKLTRTGPTAAELTKLRARNTAAAVRGLEAINSKASILATGQVYLGKPDAFIDMFEFQRSATAAQVAAAARTWVTDGSYTLTILPFPFTAQGTDVDRKAGIPKASTVADAPFPKFQRATLANGLKVVVVERHEVPLVSFSLQLDTAHAADYASLKAGTGGITLSLLDEGTKTRDSQQLADTLTLLGAELFAGGGGEQSSVQLSALKATLDPSLAVYADVVQNPAFRQADVDRVKTQQINAIRSAKLQPASIAGRVLSQLVYGRDHPYGRQSTEESIASITRDDLAAFHSRWFKPDNAVMIVVGDTTVSEIVPKLERAFGGWRGTGAPPRITVPAPAAPAKPVIYLVDRPGSPQSYVVAGFPTAPRNAEDEFNIGAFNTNFGGNFTSRINMNLREDKGWSYGVNSGVASSGTGPRMFRITAQIQTDKTKESIQELQKELTDVLGARPITAAEIATSANNSVMGLASRWGSNGAVAGAIDEILTYNLPDNYFDNYATRLKSVTPEQALAAGRKILPNQNLTWVVVGDKRRIEAGLRELGMEVRLVDADGNPAG